MKVVTIVEGKIPASKAEEFETAYASIKDRGLPLGFVESHLIKSPDGTEIIYRVETVWESREVLANNRKIWESQGQKPAALELFQKFGVNPDFKMFDIVHNIP